MLNSDFQKLSVAGIVTLYQLDATRLGGGVFYWHGHLSREDWAYIYEFANKAQFSNKSKRVAPQGTENIIVRDIIWQGQAYSPIAIQSDGLELRGDGKASTPSLVLANTINGINGAVSALCLHFNDFAGAKLTVITTLAKYLDAANFANGNPLAANEYKRQIWYVEQKTSENHSQVSFELSNPVDFEGARIPCREITNYCHWCVTGRYRGEECGYMGSAMFTEKNEPTNNPALDKCGGTIQSCKIRFGENAELPFGGFPSSTLSS